jgi:uncharacterized protein (DUF3084 family)
MRRIMGSGSGPPPEDGLEEQVTERRLELEAQATALEDAIADLERREALLRDSRASLERLLRLGTSDLDSRESELAELIRELTAREERLREEEADLTRRRSELGAVELRRASVEQREHALAEKQLSLEERERQLAEPAGPADEPAGSEPAREEDVRLAFVPGDRYRLVEIDESDVAPGAALEVEGVAHVVTRVGPSPLPGDRRRCAYLVRGVRGGPSGGGSL